MSGRYVWAWPPGSPKRFSVLVGPGGYLTCLPVGDGRRLDRYRGWQEVLRVNRPLDRKLAEYAKRWAVRTFGL